MTAFTARNHYNVIQEWNDDCVTIIDKYWYLKKSLADHSSPECKKMCVLACGHMLKMDSINYKSCPQRRLFNFQKCYFLSLLNFISGDWDAFLATTPCQKLMSLACCQLLAHSLSKIMYQTFSSRFKLFFSTSISIIKLEWYGSHIHQHY